MNIAFTICSNNYLAHAKTLGDSFLEHHPKWKFIIGLVDEFNETFDYSIFENFEIIKVKDINVQGLESLIKKYNIVELNTAVKPTYIKYLFTNYKANKLIYIDPDILVTSYFEEVITVLETKNIIVTPHICSPIDDEFAPTDYHTLRGGIYNLGFIALARYDAIKDFIQWWNDRVLKYGFCDFSKNMFYDQLWMNYLTTMWDNFLILKHPGYNMANWNLHERQLTHKENTYFVNGVYPLRFFHFSSYKFNKPDQICSYLTRYDFNSRPDLVTIFNDYQNKLLKNNVKTIVDLDFYYSPKKIEKIEVKKNKPLSIEIVRRIKKAVKILVYG